MWAGDRGQFAPWRMRCLQSDSISPHQPRVMRRLLIFAKRRTQTAYRRKDTRDDRKARSSNASPGAPESARAGDPDSGATDYRPGPRERDAITKASINPEAIDAAGLVTGPWPRFHVLDIFRLWRETPENLRGQFPLLPIIGAWQDRALALEGRHVIAARDDGRDRAIDTAKAANSARRLSSARSISLSRSA